MFGSIAYYYSMITQLLQMKFQEVKKLIVDMDKVFLCLAVFALLTVVICSPAKESIGGKRRSRSSGQGEIQKSLCFYFYNMFYF